jgi:hypothetical protein
MRPFVSITVHSIVTFLYRRVIPIWRTPSRRCGWRRSRPALLLLILIIGLGVAGSVGSGVLASPLATAIVSWEYDQIQPAAAFNTAANQYLVVWEDHHWGFGDNWDIYGRRVSESGATVGGTFGISWLDDGGDHDRMAPDVAYNTSDDDYFVVFEYAYSDTDHDILGQRVDADGSLIGSEVWLASSAANQSTPAVAYNPATNEHLVVYEQLAGSGEFTYNNIYGVIVAANGVAGTPFVISDGPVAKAAPDVAYTTTDGHFLVVWQEVRPDAGYDVLGQMVTGAGTLSGGRILVGAWEGDQIRPRVAYGSYANDFLVVWEDHHWGEAAGWDIYGQRVATDGSLRGADLTVADPGTQHATHPDVAYNPTTRNYLVVWEYAYSASDHDVFSRRVAYDGTRPETAVGVSRLGSHEGAPTVASGGGSSLLVIWEDDRNDASDPDAGLDLYAEPQTISLPTLSGRVYEGLVEDETTPLAGVSVALYCSRSAGNLGTLVDGTTTNGEGWYGLPVYGECEYYNLQETDPVDYVSVGSSSVSGIIVDSNWIQYTHSLDGKTLTGNKFWDVPAGPTDTLPPGNWSNFSPSGWVNTQSVPCSIQVEDTQSGLDVDSARYATSTDGGSSWSDWEAATCSGTDGATAPQIVSAVVPFHQDGGSSGQNQARFRVSDVEGNLGQSGEYTVLVDSVAPENPTSLTSPSHTVSTWSLDNTVTVQWSGATDASSGVAGYSYAWSHSPSTVPDDAWDTSETTLSDTSLADSDDWWFHVRAIDAAGNVAAGAVHLGPFQIDTTPPSSQISSPATANSPNFFVSWSGTDNVSGIVSYDVQVRDLTLGTSWSPLFTQVAATGTSYAGQHGHIYEFRVRARDVAGNLEPWPAGYGSHTEVATVDFEVTGIEVTQAIQDLNNSIVLITGKRTYARIHVRSLLNGDHGPVRARLVGWRGLTKLGTIVGNNTGGLNTVPANPDRGQINHSFYFDLPSHWLSGSLQLEAEVNYDRAWAETSAANNMEVVAVTFQNSPEMNLLIVDVCYEQGGTTHHINPLDSWALASWLRRAYPIAKLNLWTSAFNPCYDSLPDASDVNSDLAWNQSRKVLGANEDPYTRYYGMAVDTGGFMRGLGRRPGTVASGPTGTGNWGWDFDGSYGDWYGAHELGHTYDQKHTRGTQPPSCPAGCGCEGGAVAHYTDGRISAALTGSSAVYGFDTQKLTVYPPAWKDLMTYCGNLWISDYSYNSIRSRMISESGTSAAQRATAPGEYLAVFGTIVSGTDTVALEPFYRIEDAWDVFGRVPGDYTIRFLGSGSVVLADYPFSVGFEFVDPGADSQTGPAQAEEEIGSIAEYVPWVEGTRVVAILRGEEELARRAVSAHAPQVELIAPNGGEVLDGDTFAVTWSASDQDGDDLVFSLDYSTDGGATWTPLGAEATGTTVTLDADAVPGSDEGLFRVIASDGVNTAVDTSDAVFSVPNKAPQVQIVSPADGAIFVPGQSIGLEGMAVDLEGGTLTGSALVWRSDVAGVLGSGELLHVTDLELGTHRVTLTATDADGLKATAGLTIQVLDQVTVSETRLFLPLVLRGDGG